jgi:hypothetical protein
MPTIAFTQIEQEAVRRMIRIGTSASEKAELAARLFDTNDAEADAIRADILSYDRIANGTVRVKGGIKGTDFSLERERLHLTNTMRQRLNYDLIAEATGPDDIIMTMVRIPGWGSEYDY